MSFSPLTSFSSVKYVAGRSPMWLKVKVPKYREEERGFYKP
jgi:hypothetical protein